MNQNQPIFFKNLFSNSYAYNVGSLSKPFWIEYCVGNNEYRDKINPIPELSSLDKNCGKYVPANKYEVPLHIREKFGVYPKPEETLGVIYIEQNDFLSFFVFSNTYIEKSNQDLYGDCCFVDIVPGSGVEYQKGCINSPLFSAIENAILDSEIVFRLNTFEELNNKCREIGMSYIPKGIEKELYFSLKNL